MRIRKVSQPTPIIPDTAHISDSYSESTTDGYSCNYVNNVAKREIITGNLGSNTAFSNGAAIKFPAANITTTTDKITYNATYGTFVIGSGVSKILISATEIIHYNATNGKVYGFEIKNGNATSTFVSVRCQKSVTNPISISSSPKLLSVSQGDTFFMAFSTDSGSTTLQGNTYITIEVVE